jgi:hypothetical protein
MTLGPAELGETLLRYPITGIAGCCARAVNGHATTVLLKSLMNSRRLMASPAPRTTSGINRISHFWIENCAVRCLTGRPPCPLSAKSRHSRRPPYSITSSARATNPGEMVRPSALAVLRLITNSNFVGSSTGRSPGFSPLSMRAT